MTAKESETPISNPADSSDLTDAEKAGIQSLTYEQARDELVSIVAQLEGGQIELEESMALWQRGEALARHCNTWLDGAEAKLTSVTEAKRNDQD